MLQDDHLIRMINLTISALLRITGLKKGGEYEDALALIDMAFEQLLGLRSGVAKGLDDNALYTLLTRGEELDTRRLGLVADLLYHEGDIFAAQNRTAESQADYARALKYNLEIFFSESEEGQALVIGKIDYLLEVIAPQALEVGTQWALAGYYEETGSLARAESVLLNLAARAELRESIQPELVAFYERTLDQPGKLLNENGMSRTVLAQKLEQWKRPDEPGGLSLFH